MDGESNHPSRRGALKCLAWAGTGLLWTVVGGVPRPVRAGEATASTGGFHFVQISDSHIGFSKPANPDPAATLGVAVDKVLALPQPPALVLHTGDITHTATPAQFDDAAEILRRLRIDTHFVPGEHDILDPVTREAYLTRFGKGAGGGWYSFDQGGVHFVGLINVVELKGKGMGSLGADQLAWLEADLKGRSRSTPVVVFAHMPLWTVSEEWGWGTGDAARALALLAPFGSVSVLNGHIHQLMQKVEGNVTFHTARSTAFPQPEPGSAPAPGPKLVPAGQLRSVLGITEVALRTDGGFTLADSALGA